MTAAGWLLLAIVLAAWAVPLSPVVAALPPP